MGGGSLRGSQISGQDRHQIGQKFSSRVAQKTTEIPLLPLEILKIFFALRAKKSWKILYFPLENPENFLRASRENRLLVYFKGKSARVDKFCVSAGDTFGYF